MNLENIDIPKKHQKNFSKNQSRQILVVTGLSGSGKSTVMRALEDLGFYCVDNLPIPLFSVFLDFLFKSPTNFLKVALGIDVRGGSFLQDFIVEINKLKNDIEDNFLVKVIFLNSSDETLVRRFQETRRRHPLAYGISLDAAIKRERVMMSPIEGIADAIHFTDKSNIHELRKWVRIKFADEYVREVVVNLISFGFKYGVPAESNLVYDLRFLPNPFFIDELKNLDGRTEKIQKFLFAREEVDVYWKKLEDFLRYLLHQYYEEGRFFANVAFGCTGGKHRSVAFVERVAKQKWKHVKFLIHHRDIERK